MQLLTLPQFYSNGKCEISRYKRKCRAGKCAMRYYTHNKKNKIKKQKCFSVFFYKNLFHSTVFGLSTYAIVFFQLLPTPPIACRYVQQRACACVCAHKWPSNGHYALQIHKVLSTVQRLGRLHRGCHNLMVLSPLV